MHAPQGRSTKPRWVGSRDPGGVHGQSPRGSKLPEAPVFKYCRSCWKIVLNGSFLCNGSWVLAHSNHLSKVSCWIEHKHNSDSSVVAYDCNVVMCCHQTDVKSDHAVKKFSIIIHILEGGKEQNKGLTSFKLKEVPLTPKIYTTEVIANLRPSFVPSVQRVCTHPQSRWIL